MDLHPGITMHRIKVGSGIMGAFVALATIFICLLGLPHARAFLFSIPVGLMIALGLSYWHKHRAVDLILLGGNEGLQFNQKS